MTTLIVVILAGLMILAGVALLAFDIFARVFNNMYNRMFRRRPAGYGFAALIPLILLYVVVKYFSSYH